MNFLFCYLLSAIRYSLFALTLLLPLPSQAMDVYFTYDEDSPPVDIHLAGYFMTVAWSWFSSSNGNPTLLQTTHSGWNDSVITLTFQPNQVGTAVIETGATGTLANCGFFCFDSKVYLRVTVNPVNDAPVANPIAPVTTDEDVPVNGILSATDIDSPTLVYSIVQNGSLGQVTITNPNTGEFTYTPYPNLNGTDSFTFKANDGSLDSNVVTVNVTLNPVNDAPVANPIDPLTTNEDIPLMGILSATDIDSPILTYRIVKNATLGTVTITNLNTGEFTYTPRPDVNGTDRFAFKANDGSLDSNVVTVNMTLNPVNDAPFFEASDPPTHHDNSGGAMVFKDWAVFNPGKPNEMTQQKLSQSVDNFSDPSLFVIPPALDEEGTLTYTLAFGKWGSSTFEVTVQDDGGTDFGGIDTSTTRFTILVMPYPLPDHLRLFLQADGPGRGKVTSNTGLACQSDDCQHNPDGSLTCNPQTCSQLVKTATEVVLTPQADEGSYFSSWGGHPHCAWDSFIMNSGFLCTAYFRLREEPLTVVIQGQGSVTTATLNCPAGTCVTQLPYGTTVTLQPQPAAGWQFEAWSGDCDSTGQVVMTGTKNCGATFIAYDEDLDQILSAIEDQGPNQGDGNGDGIPDRQQNNIANFVDAVKGVYLTLQVVEGCPITDVYGELPDKYPGQNRNHRFPQGLTYFELSCAQSQVILYYHAFSEVRKNLIFYKFGPTVPADMNTATWYKYPATFAVAMVGGKPVVTATYTLTDGQLGDSTGVDGKIVDPAGIAW